MQERIEQELALLRQHYPKLEYLPAGKWVRIPSYPLPADWNRSATDVAFQIPEAYPGTPPYGIYVPAGILFNAARPNNYTEPANTQPPFGGTWGIFSWAPEDGQWRPGATVTSGSNLLNWVRGFAHRFREGQ
ncbi:MAG: E2/UBC family protein [Candidatus Methylomirabilis sp.]